MAARGGGAAAGAPAIGIFAPGNPTPRPPAFVQVLNENGYVEGRTVAAAGTGGRFGPGRVAAIAGSPPAARAAKAATATIPIVFGMGADPVKEGLVVS